MTKITHKQFDQIDKLFENQLPEYFEIINENKIKITTEDWSGSSKHVVTFKDVIDYLSKRHGFSGMRFLGDVSGDWRQIDDLANQCIKIFEILNPKRFFKSSERTWISNEV